MMQKSWMPVSLIKTTKLAYILAISVPFSSLALAQEGEHYCAIGASKVGDEKLLRIRAACAGTSVFLGEAENFKVFHNPSSQASLVELTSTNIDRVLLLRPDDNGQPIIEDLTGDLASLAGQVPWSGADNIVIDYGKFSSLGLISVVGKEKSPQSDFEQGGMAEGSSDPLVKRSNVGTLDVGDFISKGS